MLQNITPEENIIYRDWQNMAVNRTIKKAKEDMQSAVDKIMTRYGQSLRASLSAFLWQAERLDANYEWFIKTYPSYLSRRKFDITDAPDRQAITIVIAILFNRLLDLDGVDKKWEGERLFNIILEGRNKEKVR